MALRQKLCVALDVPTAAEALDLAAELKDFVGYFKVGLELFSRTGPAVVRRLRRWDVEVLLDLKLHDIPNTVERAVRQLCSFGPGLITVHASGGPVMIRAAVSAAGSASGSPKILAVTVLTSLDDQTWRHTLGFGSSLRDQVPVLAKVALAAGAHGVVLSGEELDAVRAVAPPESILVTPGIRPTWFSASDDQRRTITPAEAIRQGSTLLVIGRPIIADRSPREAAKRTLQELL